MDTTLVILTALLASLCIGFGQSEVNVDSPEPILDSVSASIKEFPYQLSVYIGPQEICSAVVIAPRWAVTTGGCADRIRPTTFVRSNSSSMLTGGMIHDISAVLKHGSYDASTKDYDVALLYVETPFKVHPVILPPLDSYGTNGYGFVTGWCNVCTNQEETDYSLRKVNMPIIGLHSCHKLYPNRITETMFCGYLERKKNVCGGDGYPLTNNGVLTGLISWGYECDAPFVIAVLTDVFKVRSWIHEVSGI